MKNVILPVILLLSVAAHAALWWSRDRVEPGASAAPVPADGAANQDVAADFAPVEPAATDTTVEPVDVWQSMQGETIAETLEQLRAAGFPERVLRAVGTVEIKRKHREQLDELVARIDDYRYWDAKDMPYLSGVNRDYMRLQEQIRSEVDALFGGQGEANPFQMAMDRRQFGPLPPELITKVREVTGDYSDLKSNIFQTNGGVMAPEDDERLAFLEAEEARDLAALMTPEQLREYQLRNDRDALTLRNRLAVMGVTEEEYRAIYAANQALDAESGPINAFAWDPKTMQARRDRAGLLREALAGTLAPERLELLEQAMDPQLMMLNSIVARYERDPQSVREAVKLQEERTREALKLRNDRSIDDAARTTALQQLQTRTIADLERLLGSDGLDTYRRTGGRWVDSALSPAPRPALPGGG